MCRLTAADPERLLGVRRPSARWRHTVRSALAGAGSGLRPERHFEGIQISPWGKVSQAGLGGRAGALRLLGVSKSEPGSHPQTLPGLPGGVRSEHCIGALPPGLRRLPAFSGSWTPGLELRICTGFEQITESLRASVC